MSDFKLGVYLIVQAFVESSEQLKEWSRTKGKKARRKVLGFEELDTSLYNGRKELDARLKNLSQKHGFAFDEGDRQSVKRITQIQMDFWKGVTDRLISTNIGGKEELFDPAELRLISEETRKRTMHTMDELSDRVEAQATRPRVPEFRTDPADTLPHMPLLPLLPGSRVSLPESAVLSQTPPANEYIIIAQKDDACMSGAILDFPDTPESKDEESNSTQAVMRRKRSTLSQIFHPKSRTDHMLSPSSPYPIVEASYTPTEDSNAILEEGQKHIERLWDSASSSRSNPQVEQYQEYARSAPLLPPLPWDASSTVTPPSPGISSPNLLDIPSPILHDTVGAFRQFGKGVRSGPVLTFSKPPPRFRRNISGPP